MRLYRSSETDVAATIGEPRSSEHGRHPSGLRRRPLRAELVVEAVLGDDRSVVPSLGGTGCSESASVLAGNIVADVLGGSAVGGGATFASAFARGDQYLPITDVPLQELVENHTSRQADGHERTLHGLSAARSGAAAE